MLNTGKIDKIVLYILIVILCALLGACFVQVYRPEAKNIEIYKQALHDYQANDYQNAYYLFSRISSHSKLKPFAIYRQSMCAEKLDDKKTLLLNYKSLINRYPTNNLTKEVLYKAAQLVYADNPQQALKYFELISRSNLNEDYKIASNYYISKINSKSLNKNKDIEIGFRNYLEKYPNGRLAPEVANSWLEYKPDNISSYDYTLIARALYYSGEYKKASEILLNTKSSDSWAISALLVKKQGDYSKLKGLIYNGVSHYSKGICRKDYINAVFEYLKTQVNLYQETSNLLNIATGENRDYIFSLKCRYSPAKDKLQCYKELYKNYPESDYSEEFLPELILQKVIHRDYNGINTIANKFLVNYPNSDKVPMVMFWRAKAANNIADFNYVVNTYPDTYYAYRSFLITQKIDSSVINSQLQNKSVEYPYKQPYKSDVLYTLIELGDYYVIEKYTDDDFIKSWAQYKNGNYIASMHTASMAMDKLKNKPPKNDLRWRLLYPLNYLEQVCSESKKYGNNEALIMALIKEESSFNPEAKSSVGASGLMQLMPQTAYEAAGYKFRVENLFNPDFNIKLGNIYYASLRNKLNNMDISAVASYNGGIGSVQIWKNRLKYSDTDEFIEQIPYEETRNYVKKVFRSYWNYTRIYQ